MNPVITGPAAAIPLPARSIAIPGVSIADAFAAGNPGTVSLNVSCRNGAVSMRLGSKYVLGSNSRAISLAVTLADANLALATLMYSYAPGVVADTITVDVWNQAGTNYGLSFPIGTAAAPPPPPPPPPVTKGTLAARARALSSMFAVNTHIDFGPTNIVPQYGDFTKLAANINYIWESAGVAPLLRDWAGNNQDTVWWADIANRTHGAKFIASIGETDPSSYQGYVDRALACGPLLAWLDGPNEEDSASTNGLTTLSQIDSLKAAAAYMPTLFAIARKAGLPLINMSYGQGWGSSYDPNFTHGNHGINGDLSAYCDFAAAHTYPQNGDPPIWNMPMLNDAARRAAASRPVAVTEFGYTVGSTGASVAEDVQAKYGLMALLDAYTLGNVLFGWYALYDDMSGSWGMFNVDHSPRPIATAFRNLLTILADTGTTAATFVPRSLAFSLSQPGIAQALLQKSDGSFWLILWNEQKLASGQNPTLLTTLTLGAAKAISVFDPMFGPAAVQTGVGTTIAIRVPAHPIVVGLV